MKYKKLIITLLPSMFIISNSYGFELSNGKIIEQGHFISNPDNAIFKETSNNIRMTSLGAQAEPLKVAADYAYHTTTNHSVFIVNDSNSTQTYYYYFNSCPQYHSCTSWGGGVQLAPGGTYGLTGTIQPGIRYSQVGFYQNKAITQTSGYDPKYTDSVATISVS